MTASTGQSSLSARDQLQQWGVMTLMALLLIGIVLFIFLVLMPDIRRRAEYSALLTSAEAELHTAQLAKAEAPARLQTQLGEAENRLIQAAQGFLNEAESSVVVNRLYAYAEAATVEIVNLQAAPPLITPTHSQRDYRFQVAGDVPTLLGFLGRINEVNLPGFVVNNVAMTPDPATTAATGAIAATGESQHMLSMNVSVLSSPYSTFSVLDASLDTLTFAPGHRNNVADLPLAEVQRQLELAWEGRDWAGAIDLLAQVTANMPENEIARIALYRAHLNHGYSRLIERDVAAAKAEFERAAALYPAGSEAANELRQLLADSTLSHRVEDQLRQEVEQAKAIANWQEVIRLLRIIAAVDPAYGPVGDELTQAYINYGNELASIGDSVAAAEQYQLAQYTPPQPAAAQSGADGTLVATQPVTSTVTPTAP